MSYYSIDTKIYSVPSTATTPWPAASSAAAADNAEEALLAADNGFPWIRTGRRIYRPVHYLLHWAQ